LLQQRMRRTVQDLGAMAAAERFFGQHRRALHGPMLERQLHCSAQLRLKHLETRKCLVEQVAQARPSVGACRIEAPHRPQAFFDHGRHQPAAAGEVTVGSRP